MDLLKRIIIVVLFVLLLIFQYILSQDISILKYFRLTFVILFFLLINREYYLALTIALLAGLIEDFSSVFLEGINILVYILFICIYFYLKKYFDCRTFLSEIWFIASLFTSYFWSFVILSWASSLFFHLVSPIFSWHLVFDFILELILNTLFILLIDYGFFRARK